MDTGRIMRLRTSTKGKVAIAALLAVVIYFSPWIFTSSYAQGLVVNFGIDALLALGLVVLVGYAGQFSLAQAAFGAIGAYGSAIGTVRLGWPPLVAMLVSAGVAALLVYAMGRPILRLRGHFLAMATLAFNEILFLLLTNSESLGGSSGFGGVPPFSVLGWEFGDQVQQMYLVLCVLAGGVWVALRVRSSREGRALRALRANETVAAAHGVNAGRAKTKAFILSAVFGSVAGSIYAHTLFYVNPAPFGVMQSVEILAIAVLGGVSSPWGALLGAAAITLIREVSTSLIPRFFGDAAVGAGEELVVGVLLVAVLVLMPQGVVGALRAMVVRLTARSAEVAVPESPPASARTSTVAESGEREVRLSAKDLTKRFAGVTAVDEVDLVLHGGEILGIIGPNGAGKSTLVNMLSGVLPVTGGQIELGHADVTGLAAHQVAARGLARTFQTPVMFDGMTVLETVLVGTYPVGRAGVLRSALPTPGVVREERNLRAAAEHALERCGLAHLRDVQASQLSLGHQKVLEIARGLVGQPSILLLDEPAAGLNRVEKLRLSALLRDLRDEGVAVLLVEHDMELVMELVDRVQVVEFGRTLRVGLPADIRADPEVIRAYLGTDDEEDVHAGH